jgi:hypothetical protein
MHSLKYPRTYHFPFSPGTTSDDRIAKSFDHLLQEPIVVTEKLDGENTCLNRYGVFARSHAAPTRNPWASYLWDTWNELHRQLGDLELFGESLYAVHSIEYNHLESYYYLFAIREGERWLSWEEVEFYAALLQVPTVPVLFKGAVDALPEPSGANQPERLTTFIQRTVQQSSAFSDPDVGFVQREGIVARVAREFSNEEFAQCVYKWVRKNHVKTDKHWTRNWQRARLNRERPAVKENK